MDDSIPERYEKNPLFAVLENYILDTIGALGADKAHLLSQMVCQIWGGAPAAWKKTLRSTLDLPDSTDADILRLWKQKQEEAGLRQESMTPEDFAQQVVDENYANLNADL